VSWTKTNPTSKEWSRLGEIELACASAGAFQLSLFIFIYSPFALSSPFFSKIPKLTQIWEYKEFEPRSSYAPHGNNTKVGSFRRQYLQLQT